MKFFTTYFADLVAHVLPDFGREAVVKTGPDARLRDLVDESAYVGPIVGDAGRGRARHCTIRHFRRAEYRLHPTGKAGALDAMRARVFRMHGRRLELPRGIALDRRI